MFYIYKGYVLHNTICFCRVDFYIFKCHHQMQKYFSEHKEKIRKKRIIFSTEIDLNKKCVSIE